MRLDGYRGQILAAMGIAWGGCDVEEGSGLPASEAPPPGVLSLTGPADLHTGATIQFRVGGASPGATVSLIGGQSTGAGPCPPQLGGLCVDIPSPRVLGSARASANGNAVIDVILPHELADGVSLYFQAAHGGIAPAKSQPISDLTSHPVRTCGEYDWLTPSTYGNGNDFFACVANPQGRACPAVGALTQNQLDWLWLHNSGQAVFQGWGGWSIQGNCFEDTVEDACCYHISAYAFAIGRPFEVGGAPRLAAIGGDPSWCSDVRVDAGAVSRGARRRLAWAWTRTARGEHASVAAFARFILQLSQVGAPADLLVEATRAMADEIRHARDAFAIASAFAGEVVGAGPLDTRGALEDGVDLAAIVRATFREGCIAETIAAAQVAHARELCVDPVMAEVLGGVAADETRHAQLAWRFVRWALREHPALAEVVRAELANGLTSPVVAVDPHGEEMRRHGQLPEEELHAVARQVFDEVVVPCARALLGAPVEVAAQA